MYKCIDRRISTGSSNESGNNCNEMGRAIFDVPSPRISNPAIPMQCSQSQRPQFHRSQSTTRSLQALQYFPITTRTVNQTNGVFSLEENFLALRKKTISRIFFCNSGCVANVAGRFYVALMSFCCRRL